MFFRKFLCAVYVLCLKLLLWFIVILYLNLVLSSVKSAYAQETYFNFHADSFLVMWLNIMSVNFYYDVNPPDAKFVVRPVISTGTAAVFNKTLNEWIDGNDLWTCMPVLEERMRVKIQTGSGFSSDLYFQIQDLKTSKIYKTPVKKVWTSEVLDGYLIRLNKKLMSD